MAVSLPADSFAKEKGHRQELLNKEKKLEDVKKQIREEKKSVKTISEKETNILGELENINKNLNEKREELRAVDAQAREIQAKVNSANANIGRLDKERKALSDRLKLRMRAMYKMNRGEAMRVLFLSDDSKDLGRRHKYLTMIMDSDTRLIEGYEKNLEKLGKEKEKLSVLYKDAEATKKIALAKKIETEAVQKEKTTLLKEVKLEKDRRLKVISELEQAAAELSNLLTKLRAENEGPEEPALPAGSGFGAMKGRLRMPVEGNIVSFYGKVKHPKFQTITFNNGIVIEAPVGTPVKSVYEGKVIYVGWLKGYGQVLIIDHKGGFYTLFAHLSKVLKEKGDAVDKGDEVGLVGDTGMEAASGLYFEIRQKGVPRDPMAWIAAK